MHHAKYSVEEVIERFTFLAEAQSIDINFVNFY